MRAVDDDEPKAAEGLTPWLPTLPEAEAATVARAAGMVDCTLNRSAWNLGRFVAAGEVDHHEVEDVLIAAAVAAGHPEGRARRTVQGAIRRRRTSP